MLCKKCGRSLPDDALLCCYCGASQQQKKHSGRKNGNGSGYVFLHHGAWMCQIVTGYKLSPDGEKKLKITKSKGGFKTKTAAKNYIATLKAQTIGEKKAAPSLDAYWALYSQGEMEKLSKSKQVAYRGAWKKLADLHARKVDTITVSDLRSCVSSAASTYYTAKDCKAVLTALFRLAAADGHCSRDLPSFIVLPDLQETERQAFTDIEQANLWRLYEQGDLRAAIPLLMICTGMMPGEMQSLRLEHIDLQSRTITGVGMKTKVRKKSPVYLPEDVIPVVEDLIAHAQPSGYLWKRNEEEWYADYYASLSAAHCRRLVPYCCRHTTATRLAVTERIAPQTIRRVMRWSTSKMLDRYAHPDDDAARAAADTIKKIPVQK